MANSFMQSKHYSLDQNHISISEWCVEWPSLNCLFVVMYIFFVSFDFMLIQLHNDNKDKCSQLVGFNNNAHN